MKVTTRHGSMNYITREFIDYKNKISYTILGNQCKSTRVSGGPQHKYCFPSNMPSRKNADGTETIKTSVANTTIKYTFARRDGHCFLQEVSSSGSGKMAVPFSNMIARSHFSHLSFMSFRWAIKDACGYKRNRREGRHPNSFRMQEE